MSRAPSRLASSRAESPGGEPGRRVATLAGVPHPPGLPALRRPARRGPAPEPLPVRIAAAGPLRPRRGPGGRAPRRTSRPGTRTSGATGSCCRSPTTRTAPASARAGRRCGRRPATAGTSAWTGCWSRTRASPRPARSRRAARPSASAAPASSASRTSRCRPTATRARRGPRTPPAPASARRSRCRWRRRTSPAGRCARPAPSCILVDGLIGDAGRRVAELIT